LKKVEAIPKPVSLFQSQLMVWFTKGIPIPYHFQIPKKTVRMALYLYSSRGVRGSGLTASKSNLNAFENDSLG